MNKKQAKEMEKQAGKPCVDIKDMPKMPSMPKGAK